MKRYFLLIASITLICFSCFSSFAYSENDFATNQIPVGCSNDSQIIDSSVHLEYHSFITEETIRVTPLNADCIIERIQDDRNSSQPGAETLPSRAIESNKSIFTFSQAANIPKNTSLIHTLDTLASSPYSGVCQIYTVYKNANNQIVKMTLSSGCFISENAILTAAHSVHDSEHGTPSAIRIYYCFPLTDASGNTYGNLGFCSAVSSIYCSTYNTNVDTMYDYGIINIASYAGSNTGVFKLATITPTTSTELQLLGYPSATSSNGYGSNGSTILSIPNPLRKSYGTLDKIVSNYFRAKRSSIYGEPGMSGGALIKYNSGYYELLGIYVARRTLFFTEYSYFCRINSTVRAFCQTYGDVNNVPSSLYLS